MSKGIRNALIIGGSIILVVVILAVYMYLPLDGLQYSAGKYSTGNDNNTPVSSQDEKPSKKEEEEDREPNGDEYVKDVECTIIGTSLIVSPGEVATVRMYGRAYTKYSIEVIYTTGPSTARGLEDKISNAEGYIEWSWTVGTNVPPGVYEIYVKNEFGEGARSWMQVVE